MKKSTLYSSFSFSKIYCALFGHKYVTSKRVTNHIKEYTCTHCKEQATINSRGRLEAMTPKLKEINDTLSFVHQKKEARNNRKIDFQAAS
ncbi:hypothetical protein [Aquimarina sp. RZ0]|uniref:hypothetical protein n=1 Tax=Aquimarina sp. RZ0 TaxID=2607730 RepID=UPI0011F194A4|nr:hypothetical protein [Aquimarina sp. RZ0]KAA1247340.1 hypothetical protein F0000_04115 [Aquimarina sp. RZ0]